MEKLEPESYYEKHGLYLEWLPIRPVEKNEIDKALKKIEKKFGKRLQNYKQIRERNL